METASSSTLQEVSAPESSAEDPNENNSENTLQNTEALDSRFIITTPSLEPAQQPPTEQKNRFAQRLDGVAKSVEEVGRIVKAYGTTVHVSGISAGVGQRCVVIDKENGIRTYGDVVGINGNNTILYLLGSLEGISNRSEVRLSPRGKTVPFSQSLLGCVLDGAGQFIYQPHEQHDVRYVPIERPAPDPLTRLNISSVFSTGVKAIDSLLTVGEGQRLGIFAAAGVGKSTLLSMLAKHADADAIVIGLIGERGREVREFIEHNLGPQGLAKSVMVVSTSDRPALERVTAAQTATTIAEGFRARGQRVLLLIDSITRYARALREIGLSVGEPPSRRGYPPSVFAELPRLLERAGNNETGSITAFYTILAEDEETTDPVSEEVKSILDGHIMLSRSVAESGQYPPVDVLPSASRVMGAVASVDHVSDALQVRSLIAKYKENELLLAMGEYQEGADEMMDRAIRCKPLIDSLLKQSPDESFPFDHCVELLKEAAL